MTDQSILNILGLVFLLAMASALRPVVAEERDMDLILTGDSVTLDRSTKYLANGYTKAAIRYANRALGYGGTPVETLIAHQNLCIAWAEEGDAVRAERHCNAVREAAVPVDYLRPLKDGLYTTKYRGRAQDDYPRLSSVIEANLARYGDGGEAPHAVTLTESE